MTMLSEIVYQLMQEGSQLIQTKLLDKLDYQVNIEDFRSEIALKKKISRIFHSYKHGSFLESFFIHQRFSVLKWQYIVFCCYCLHS